MCTVEKNDNDIAQGNLPLGEENPMEPNGATVFRLWSLTKKLLKRIVLNES